MQRAKHFELPLMRAQWLHNTQTANPAQASTLAWINLATFDMPDDADAPRQPLSGFPRPCRTACRRKASSLRTASVVGERKPTYPARGRSGTVT